MAQALNYRGASAPASAINYEVRGAARMRLALDIEFMESSTGRKMALPIL